MRDVLGLFELGDKLISDFEAFNYKRAINYTEKTALVSRAIEHSEQFLKDSLKA